MSKKMNRKMNIISQVIITLGNIKPLEWRRVRVSIGDE